MHRVGVLAAEYAGVSKVFEASFSREFMHEMSAAFEEYESDEPGERDEQPEPDTFGLPEADLTHRVDVSDFVELKRDALLRHESQISPDHPMAKMPLDVFARWSGYEWFRDRARPRDGADFRDDVFANRLNVARIYLVRHGEATGYDGADPGLSELGASQARQVAQRLAEIAGAPIELVTSPLRRARETAQPLAAAMVDLGVGASTRFASCRRRERRVSGGRGCGQRCVRRSRSSARSNESGAPGSCARCRSASATPPCSPMPWSSAPSSAIYNTTTACSDSCPPTHRSPWWTSSTVASRLSSAAPAGTTWATSADRRQAVRRRRGAVSIDDEKCRRRPAPAARRGRRW